MIFVHEPRNRIHRRSIDSRKRRPYRRGPLCSRLDPRSIAISWLCGVSSESNGPTDPGIPFQNPVNVCGWVEAASWLAPRRCRYCSCKAPSSATETAESFHLIISLSGSAATTPLPLPSPTLRHRDAYVSNCTFCRAKPSFPFKFGIERLESRPLLTPLLFDHLEFIVFAKPTFVEIGNRRGSARSDVETSVFRGRGAKIGECCEGECPQSAIFRLILLWRRSNYEFSVNKTSFPAFIPTPSRKFKQASNFAGTSRNFCRGRALNRQEKKENSLPLSLSNQEC